MALISCKVFAGEGGGAIFGMGFSVFGKVSDGYYRVLAYGFLCSCVFDDANMQVQYMHIHLHCYICADA